MFVCVGYGGNDSREELADKVLKVGGRHYMVEGVPCTVCARRGEQSFSSLTAEIVWLMLHGNTEPTGSVSMRVYEFAY